MGSREREKITFFWSFYRVNSFDDIYYRGWWFKFFCCSPDATIDFLFFKVST